jgi:hypothetical protein
LTGATSNSSAATSQATATLSIAGSPHTVTANYVDADGNFSNSAGSLSGGQVVNKPNTATNLTSSQNSSALGQSVTFTATVSAVAPGTGTPTGTVTFFDGGSAIGTGTLNSGVATFATSALVAGNNTITTSYSGDGTFNGSTASLTGNPQVVVAPPVIAKAFSPGSIAPNGTSALTFTITNPAANTVAEAGVAFSDTLPTGLVVATPNALSNGCGGTATATAGGASITLTGGNIAANSNCTVAVSVTGTAMGQYTNTTGAVSSTNGGTGNTASANLTVAMVPAITEAFGAASIPLSGTTSLTLNISNPNASVTVTGLAFTDNLPAGLVVASTPNLNNTCGGAATAVGGSGSVSLSGGGLAASTNCTVSVSVQGVTAGIKNNSVQVSSANVGTGNTSNASVGVVAPPSISKSFGTASIPLTGSTTLSFTTQNNNATTTLTGIGFTDTLPAGLIISTPNGLSGSCSGGTITATQGTTSISLSGASLVAGASCNFSVSVTAIGGGAQNNVTGKVTSTEGGTGGTASASLTVLAPDLTITKSHNGNFTQGDVGDNYQISVSNVGAAPTAGTVTVTENLPPFLIAGTTAMSGSGWTCTPGTLTCTRGDSLANGNSYPPIMLTVAVAVNAPPMVTNSVTVSGGGETNTANNTAADSTTINQLPGPPLTIALLVPFTQTIKNGNSASFVFDVVSRSATLGNINFSCSGLPARAACSFNPASENQGDAQVTMTVTTTADTGAAAPFGTSRGGPVYAALLFPMLGVVSLAAVGRRGKKNRMRLVMFLGSFLILMALFGCGGRPTNGTPPGAFPITVTATSVANSTVTASTQVVVTVQ